ncbi:hypothetical protein M5K25_027933 [Dendrobium thyrsiflorum]|uniref:Uncharacterized protein n=1 Tax=Dendrobium thyrsiflorum TaxID=117978 RepID=A0ABD0TV45_DENTH
MEVVKLGPTAVEAGGPPATLPRKHDGIGSGIVSLSVSPYSDSTFPLLLLLLLQKVLRKIMERRALWLKEAKWKLERERINRTREGGE